MLLAAAAGGIGALVASAVILFVLVLDGRPNEVAEAPTAQTLLEPPILAQLVQAPPLEAPPVQTVPVQTVVVPVPCPLEIPAVAPKVLSSLPIYPGVVLRHDGHDKDGQPETLFETCDSVDQVAAFYRTTTPVGPRFTGETGQGDGRVLSFAQGKVHSTVSLTRVGGVTRISFQSVKAMDRCPPWERDGKDL